MIQVTASHLTDNMANGPALPGMFSEHAARYAGATTQTLTPVREVFS
jgi:hypothetical protein